MDVVSEEEELYLNHVHLSNQLSFSSELQGQNFTTWKGTGIMGEEEHDEIVIRITLTEYLDTLRANEGQKPPNQRKEVPNISQLVDATGIGRTTLYNVAANKFKSVKLDVLEAVINDLRRRGFSASVSDVIRQYPASEVER